MKALWIFRFAICAGVVVSGAWAAPLDGNWGVQAAWDNPNANMTSGSLKPGYAQLAWEPGTVLPVKLRNGMVTMVNLPKGEQIEDAVVGNEGFFQINGNQGGRTLYITPAPDNMGSDTNLIVTGKSGNVYTFYLRSEPSNASEITYSQVDVVLDGGARLPMAGAATAPSGGAMNSIFKNTNTKSTSIGVDGEDYDWIKTMKIDPSEFRFDLDIFVPNPDDYVIAPERVWRDRVFTYIDFGDKVISMTQRPVVSLLVEGGESPVGFRTDGQDGRLLIVEAVGDMVLRSGQRIVCIKKRAKPFLVADTASVMALAEANVAQSMMSGNSLNNMIYNDNMTAINAGYENLTASPTYIGNVPNAAVLPTMPAMPMNTGAMMYGTYDAPALGNGTRGISMMPTERVTAGSYLPNSNIPLITSNQGGVAVELRSDSSVKALDEYWAGLVARFSGNDGKGLLNKYKDSVFYAVDEEGVGELGAKSSAARLYRLRIGPMPDIDTAQQLCDQLLKFSGASCQVVRIQ
ncbi:MAG: TrbG/VirB9 family P-type conjugative transfer protein [Alphaproteobacteria bacterium]|nr:TrbG/VirB9 family P-type conjugative transfer protein [Alphaproteobacteria bacterium]